MLLENKVSFTTPGSSTSPGLWALPQSKVPVVSRCVVLPTPGLLHIQGFHRWRVRGDCPPKCGLLGRIHRMISGSVERKRIGQTNANPPYTFQSSGRGFLPVIDLVKIYFHAFVPQPSQKLAVLFVLFASILPCVSDSIVTVRSSSIHFVVSVIVNSCSSIDSTGRVGRNLTASRRTSGQVSLAERAGTCLCRRLCCRGLGYALRGCVAGRSGEELVSWCKIHGGLERGSGLRAL